MADISAETTEAQVESGLLELLQENIDQLRIPHPEKVSFKSERVTV